MLGILEQVILKTAASWEHDRMAYGETRPIIGKVDEPCLERLLLVLLELLTGYVVLEAAVDDRMIMQGPVSVQEHSSNRSFDYREKLCEISLTVRSRVWAAL